MFRARVMPCLLLRNAGLVKTVRFANPTYVGDPINAVRIFNEREVDELVFLDITATVEGREPPYQKVAEIAGECFMPLAYGGGLRNLEQMERILRLGAEKVCVNTAAVETPDLVREASRAFGNQSVVVSMDVKRGLLGGYRVVVRSGRSSTKFDPVDFARRVEDLGAGEIFLNSVDRDGAMQGFDLALIKKVTGAVEIPVIACGGAGSAADLAAAVKQGGASAAAAGSLFVFHGKHRAVLISFPSPAELEALFESSGVAQNSNPKVD